MPSSSGPSNDGIISGINVTPLVDVMLVLLVIFIVTAKIIVTPAVPLDLPHAAHGEEVQVILSVIVPVRGPVLVNGAPLPNDEALTEKARAAAAGDPELRAVIQADGDVPHRRVIHILDQLKGAGLTRVAFGALPDEKQTNTP
jgi:biopolymer transport protein ExbD